MPALARPAVPLRAERRVRILRLNVNADETCTLVSDGSPVPQKLIKPEVIDRAFGAGMRETLTQPDHWRMIAAGWFGEEDLYLPEGFSDPQFHEWHANCKPEVEAFDLLIDLFPSRLLGPWGGSIRELGLIFGERPSTPRLAKVQLTHENRLPALVTAIAERTDWVAIDPMPKRVSVS